MIEPDRRRLPNTRKSVTRRIEHSGELDIYITVGFFDQMHACVAGEVFIKIGKEGSTLQGLMDIIAIQMSIMLQYGIPWPRIARKIRDTNFEPLNKDGKSVAHAIVQAVDELVLMGGKRNASV